MVAAGYDVILFCIQEMTASGDIQRLSSSIRKLHCYCKHSVLSVGGLGGSNLTINGHVIVMISELTQHHDWVL